MIHDYKLKEMSENKLKHKEKYARKKDKYKNVVNIEIVDLKKKTFRF